jgi:hypothetical protein
MCAHVGRITTLPIGSAASFTHDINSAASRLRETLIQLTDTQEIH